MKKTTYFALISLILLTSCANDAFYLEKEYKNANGGRSLIFHQYNLGYTNTDFRYSCYYEKEICRHDYSHKYSWMSIKEDTKYIHVYVLGMTYSDSNVYELLGYFYDKNCFVAVDYNGGVYVNGASTKYSTESNY